MAELQVNDLRFLGRGPYNFRVAAGKVLAVSGPSGSGKSLLLRAIADLEPHEGRLSLDGNCSDDFAGHEWRRQVMYLPAESQWWREQVFEHFPLQPEADTLAAFGFAPESLEWEISRLSTGEKQRLAILRVLLYRPAVLLLDEPTASLDQQNIGKIEALLLEYLKKTGGAAVWVSHDPAQISRVADEQFCLKGEPCQ